MRTVHLRLLLVTLGLGMFTAGALSGCGGGDDSSGTDQDGGGDGSSTTDGGGGGDDGGGGGTDGGQDTGPTTQANANDVTIYLGQVAQVDGSTSVPPGATFAWTISSVPGGSGITTGNLLNASAAKASFTPDVIGDYVLKLTVTSGSSSSTKNVTVHAIPAQVFYSSYRYLQPDGGALDGAIADLIAVPAVGGGAHSVMCPFVDNGSAVVDGILGVIEYGAADWWEGPAGSDGKAVTTGYTNEPDGGFKMSMFAATTSTSCTGAKQPVLLDSLDIAGSILLGPHVPKISPDGSRVAFGRVNPDGTGFIQTIGMDGTGMHVVAGMELNADGGTLPEASVTGQEIAVRWVSATKVAWGRHTGSAWEIVTADDANGATAQLAITGTGSVVQFEALPNGDFVVEGTAQSDGGASQAQDILVYHPNATTKEAELVHNLSALTDAGTSSAHGLTLSPDKTRVAYTASDVIAADAGAGKNQFALYTAPVDGSTAATRVPGVPFGAGGNVAGNRGPRWIAGGTALSWEQDQGSFDAGDGAVANRPAILAGPAAGGGFSVLAISDNTSYAFSIPNANCSVARGPGSALMAFGSLAAFLGLVARRRRRAN